MLTRIPRDHQYKIPPAFRNLQRFIFCKLVVNERTGKTDKLPCDYYGNVCSAHDPAKWLTLAQLNSSPVSEDPRFTVAIVIVEGDGIWCLDLDGCFTPDGKLTLAAQTIVDMFPGAYIETSISGNGLHIFGRGSIGPHRTRAAGLELYTRARFIALTGLDARGDAGLDYSAHLEHFVDAYGLRLTADEVQAAAVPGDGPRPGSTGQFLTDDELISALCSAESRAGAFGDRARPRDLWHGNADVLAAVWPASGRFDGCTFDRSSADAALMMHLSYYTGGHIARMVALFRRSALYRPELSDADLWRKNANSINKAIAGGKFYDKPPRVQGVQPMPAVTPGGMVLPPVPGTPPVPGMPAVPGVLPVRTLPPILEGAAILEGEDDPIEWTVQDWIPHEALTLFGGDGGIGKSTVTMQLAMACAGMTPWLGRFVTPRRVLFVSGEDDIKRLRRAARRIAKATGNDCQNLSLLSLAGDESPFLVHMDRRGLVTDTTILDLIAQAIIERACNMIILDPIANLFDGDELSRAQVTRFLSLLRSRIAKKLKCTVVLVAHPSVSGIESGRGYSGNTAWNNSVNSRLYLRKTDDDDKRELELMKANDARPGQIINMEWKNPIFVTSENHTVATTLELSERQIQDICNDIERGEHLQYDGNKMWAGYAIARAIGYEIDSDMISDRERRKNMKVVKNVLAQLLRDNIIEKSSKIKNKNDVPIYRRVISDDKMKKMDC